MTTAKYTYGTLSGFGKSITYHRIEADVDAIQVEPLSSSVTVANSGKYGVNGTFFHSSGVYGIAMNKGAAVKSGGTMTSNAAGVQQKRGTLFRHTNGNVFAQKVRNYSEAISNSSNVDWAIGGISLHLDQAHSQTSYNNAIINTEPSGGVPIHHEENGWRVDTNINRPRTVIVYKNGKVNLIVFVTGVTAWQARTLCFSNLSLSAGQGVLLDGGGSSAMRWRYDDGSDDSFHVEPRRVQNMVTVNPTYWI